MVNDHAAKVLEVFDKTLASCHFPFLFNDFIGAGLELFKQIFTDKVLFVN